MFKNVLLQPTGTLSLKTTAGAIPLLFICLVISVAFPATVWGDQNATPPETTDRRDVHMGTFHENMHIGKDPVTGDNVISVSPAPKMEPDNSTRDMGPVIITPEISPRESLRPGDKITHQ